MQRDGRPQLCQLCDTPLKAIRGGHVYLLAAIDRPCSCCAPIRIGNEALVCLDETVTLRLCHESCTKCLRGALETVSQGSYV